MSDEFVTDRFNNCWPEDEIPPYTLWKCAKCGDQYVDPDDVPYITPEPQQPRLYWLSTFEPLCEDCAVNAGIPPIDKD